MIEKWSEQLVQLVSHMAFDRAQLGVADRNLLRPVVGDDNRPVILARPARSPARRDAVGVVMQVIRAFGPATRRAATDFARKGHLGTLPRVHTSHKCFIAA